ncbi:hypothetical protein [Chryseobacterium binzhouense]|uniref:hypothetical protein n=1 Tax=Chryseobacterium binzhouense TaxID=2593646 RepID=UPI00289B3E58|nr:hypothetical protein [Chryseobacterium binzhouense]
MNGEKLYLKLSQRDYSGTDSDIYAQLLTTIFFNLSGNDEIQKFFDLIEKAEDQNKKISVNDAANENDEYRFSDLILI